MELLYTVLAALVALGLLVTVHELGHFAMARYCGVRVLRFSVGFGAPLLRWQDRMGTEFVIASVPLGGYVKMLDEREGKEAVAGYDLDRAFNRQSVKARCAIVAAGPLVNFLLAWLLFWGLALQDTQQVKPILGSVSPSSLASQAGLQAGQEILSIDGVPTPSWNAVTLQLTSRLGESGYLVFKVRDADGITAHVYSLALHDWLRDEDDAADPLSRLGIFPWQPSLDPIIAELDPKGPARASGLQLGDRILKIDADPVENWTDLVARVQSKPKQSVVLQVLRAGQLRSFQLVIGQRESQSSVGYLGAGVASAPWPKAMLREVHFSFLEACFEGGRKTWYLTRLTLDSLKKMLFGQLSVKNLSGPITIVKVAGASAQSGLNAFLNFLGYLSVSLGVLNLLPIPVLDGGHLAFYLVEWGRGRPLSERMQQWGMQIGFVLMFGLMLVALLNDLGRL